MAQNERMRPRHSRRVLAVVGGVHQKRQRHLEGVGHLAFVQRQVERRRHQGDDGRDMEAGAGTIAVEEADRLHMAAGEADLLFRLAQCRLDRPRHRPGRCGRRES